MNDAGCSYSISSYTDSSVPKAIMPSRPKRSNKGDFGRVLCVCGSYGMAGAAYLCAKAAYRSGAGLVEIFTHESNRTALQTLIPEAIITAYEDYTLSLLLSCIERSTCVVVGCGLGASAQSRTIISDLLHNVDAKAKSIVLDADALNLIARNPSLLKHARGCVVTPHAMEMSRLTSMDVTEILNNPLSVAFEYAKKHQLICVLKDHNSVVSDGSERLYVNNTGNSGMATGGSGDVLAGILAGLLSQKKHSSATVFETVTLGVYLHGFCGDIASEKLSEYSVMAGDIIDAIPFAIKEICK